MKNLLLLFALCATICFGCKTDKSEIEKPGTEDSGPDIPSVGIDFKNLISLNRQNINTVRSSLPGALISEETEIYDERENIILKYSYDTNLGTVTLTHSFVNGVLRTSRGEFNYTSPAKAIKGYKALSNDIEKAVSLSDNQDYMGSITKGISPEWSSARYYGAYSSDNGRDLLFIDLADIMRSYTPTGNAKDYLNCRESWFIRGLNPMLDTSKTASCTMDSSEKDKIVIGFSINSPDLSAKPTNKQ